MAARVIASLLTLLTNAAAAVLLLLMMLVAMNGMHESDATWGLRAFLAFAVLILAGMSIGAFFLVKFLQKKNFSAIVGVLITVPVCVVVGILAMGVSALLGIGIADFVRQHY